MKITSPPDRALPIFVSCAAGPRSPLRYATRSAEPYTTETKIGDHSQKEIERKAHPL